jgi:hypothetical protein
MTRTMTRDEPDLNLLALPPHVRERWSMAVERAARKTQAAVPNPAVGPLVKAAQKGSTAAQRMVWLQRAASAWAQPLQGVAACRRGCAHCCHIPVTISSVEAALIGRHIGQAPAQPGESVRLDAFNDLTDAVIALQALSTAVAPSPCPFLREDVCSIYRVRPMACRLLLNLDDDDLLCRRVPGQDIPVPYADSSQFKALFLMAQLAAPLADIRALFAPQGTWSRRGQTRTA